MKKPAAPQDKPAIRIRRLETTDIPFAAGLNALVGWNQTAGDWRGYVEFEPEGCFLAEADGRPAGTATTIRYGNRFGWIGMVLVPPEFRRFGIGTRLLRQSIDYLRASDMAGIKLDATPMGRNVYVPLGFVDEYELSRYDGIVPMDVAPAGSGIEPFEAEAVDVVAAFDEPVFGAARLAVLRSMRSRNPDYCFVVRENGRIRGYIIAREGRQAVQIGPWIADDAGCAEQLLRAVFGRVGGRRAFVDVPHPNPAGRALIEKFGFGIQRGYTRMYFGENRHPGQPYRVFGTSGAEKG